MTAAMMATHIAELTSTAASSRAVTPSCRWDGGRCSMRVLWTRVLWMRVLIRRPTVRAIDDGDDYATWVMPE